MAHLQTIKKVMKEANTDMNKLANTRSFTSEEGQYYIDTLDWYLSSLALTNHVKSVDPDSVKLLKETKQAFGKFITSIIKAGK